MGWRVTNNSLSGHLQCIEALAAQAHIGTVQQLLAVAILTIRIYNYAAVPPEPLSAARATADRIFEDAGISLAWIDCRVPGSSVADPCTERLADGEFVLRLRETPGATPLRHITLGSSLVDLHAGGGVLITVDPRLVATVARQAGADFSIVLGRAMAHEVGHIVIGTASHAPTGLMRALWSQRELCGNRPADWRFSNDEASLMRRNLLGIRRAN